MSKDNKQKKDATEEVVNPTQDKKEDIKELTVEED